MEHYIKLNFLLHIYKVKKEIITFSNTKIKEREFHRCKYPFFSEDVYINNILVSDKVFPGENMDDHYKIKPLIIILPNTIAYIKILMVKLNGCIF